MTTAVSAQVKGVLDKAAAAEAGNNITAAGEILYMGLRENPASPEITLRLAQVYERQKNFVAAQAIYSRFVSEGKTNSVVALGLARCLLADKRYDQARKILEDIRQKSPNHPEALTGLAACLRHKGAPNEAEKLVRKVLSSDPKCKPALFELAQIQLELKEHEKAITTLERNLDREDMQGESIDLWLDILRKNNRQQYIRERLEYFIKKYPKRPEFLFAYGLLLNAMGELETARQIMTRVVELLPQQSRVIYELGVMERIAGNIEKSHQLVGRSLELNADHPSALRTFGIEYKYSYGDASFSRLNAVAAQLSSKSMADQVQLHFAQAKAFDDVGELTTAFQHYAVGGDKRKKLEPYNERATSRVFQVIKTLVNKDVLAKIEQPGFEDETPVFVLGMPRSGSSLLEQVLSSHPDVFGAGELKYITQVLENIDVLGRRFRMGADIAAEFDAEKNASYEMRGRRYVDLLRKLAPRDDYKRIVDKMPGNFNFIGLIHKILPKARIIHSERHPIETCLSCYRTHFSEGHQWTYNLRELGRYYRHYWDLMEHWRRTLPPESMLEVRYEDMVRDLEGEARRVIAYTGLPWNDKCLRFHETDRPVKTASASQVRKPIYSTSTNRWQKYEAQLKPLILELGPVIKAYEEKLEKPSAPIKAEGEKNRKAEKK